MFQATPKVRRRQPCLPDETQQDFTLQARSDWGSVSRYGLEEGLQHERIQPPLRTHSAAKVHSERTDFVQRLSHVFSIEPSCKEDRHLRLLYYITAQAPIVGPARATQFLHYGFGIPAVEQKSVNPLGDYKRLIHGIGACEMDDLYQLDSLQCRTNVFVTALCKGVDHLNGVGKGSEVVFYDCFRTCL